MSKEFAVIVAGGSGSRMKSDIPKQFLEVNGLPIIFHTINAFRSYSEELELIIVLPTDQFDFWKELCDKFKFDTHFRLVAGGATRFNSVKNGLESITAKNGLVAVHDAVRPIISADIIANSFKKAAINGTAVVSVPLKDSIRSAQENGKNQAEDRSLFRIIQTPQTFNLEWMQKAFTVDYQPFFTDCASVLEAAGYPIHLIEGSYENIKITTPEDLKWAEVYLGKN